MCHQGELVTGHIQSTGLCYFRPAKTKFWTLKDSNIGTQAHMCSRCGFILWFGDRQKLTALREANAAKAQSEAAALAETPGETKA